ncbi:PqiC family protein [Nitrosovibrio tenuis]|uniref:ABC-type transport auxiliary lipoprotein component domain-containing protein n=1 Tax=Nitrosovibrio tenuis TaxID=1233 RepID=A0A1H7MEN1_9PROT|nr:PqiC family protein [Nitrosovibrio tenuis]SEL09634.1 hypothetical protein SAMN05216387_10548 [Nitrosovibrio tenuis]
MTPLARGILGMITALLAAGCASVPETRFYTLSVPSESPERKVISRDSSTPIFIDILPISVPERLARPQLVVRSTGARPEAQLFILEQDRWSSAFNYELRDAFAAGIARQTGAVNEARSLRTPGQPGYRIAIELSQFDAIVGDRVQARFGWTITRSTDGRSAICSARITEPVTGGIEGVVKGTQRAVASVTADISKNLIELDMGRAASCIRPMNH